jgi:hypothetical protein
MSVVVRMLGQGEDMKIVERDGCCPSKAGLALGSGDLVPKGMG